MTEDEMVEYLAKKAVLWSLIYGAGLSTELPAKEKFMLNYWDAVPNTLDNGKLGVGTLYGKVVLPPKICHYRKPKLYWFGEVHGSNNFVWNEGFTMARHWAISPDRLTLKGRNPSEGLSVWPAAPMGSTTGRNPLAGKRFIGISEPTEHGAVDSDFFKRFTGDEWVETKTFNKKSSEWKPQGEIFIGGSQPLRMNNKSKETIERVQRIEFPEG